MEVSQRSAIMIMHKLLEEGLVGIDELNQTAALSNAGDNVKF